jgi:phage internal scaffolding protein
MKRYEMTGHDAFADRKASGMFVDLASAPEFQVAMGVIASANEAFDSLPANVRKRFSNDPAEFLAFFEDPGNQEEAIKLGLAERLPDPTPPSLANNSSDADAGEGKE